MRKLQSALTALSFAAVLLVASSALAQDANEAPAEPPPAEPATAATDSCAQYPCQSCGDIPSCTTCDDTVTSDSFVATDCWTTPYGPAYADIVVSPHVPKRGTLDPLASSYMLYCEGATYALCFFSGPSTPTGGDVPGEAGVVLENQPLGCQINTKAPPLFTGELVAQCQCRAFTTGPYFVIMNEILNLGVYNETVAKCGHEGKKCRNINNCGRDGSRKECRKHHVPPVCKYVADGSLMQDADLISTFSFAMSCPVGDTYNSEDCNSWQTYRLGTTPCTAADFDPSTSLLYAGCMTAPCYKEGTGDIEDGDVVTCNCPTYSGDFQVGQSGQTCQLGDGTDGAYVWSASNAVAKGMACPEC